jgi:hypothetical protein
VSPLVIPAEARLRAIADIENLLGEAVRLVLSDTQARVSKRREPSATSARSGFA